MTSVNAELFHRQYDPPVHYGPVWNKKREIGETFAACDGDTESHATLTTHVPWVTCAACKEWLSSRNEESKR